MATYIDFHALVTLPPSNVNRGEDGAPKSAYFGGVQRQRISSQALKSAQRRAFSEHVDTSDLGVRTKRIVEVVADEVVRRDPSIDEATALKWAEDAFKKAGFKLTAPKKSKNDDEEKPPVSGYLVFLSRHQIERLAEELINRQGEALTKKEVLPLIDTEHSIDLSLFGRMVADDSTLNVDAACQYAHALGVHESTPDFDYYTAVDDEQQREEITGAGMIGTVEMVSSTLYKYATINVDQLKKNLGNDEAVKRAVAAFTTTFIETLPSGKQNTFAALTMPDLVSVMVRKGRPISLVNAFEDPISGVSRRRAAVERLAHERTEIDTHFGTPAEHAWFVTTSTFADAAAPLGEQVTSPELVTHVADAAQAAAQNVEADQS